MTDDQLLLDYLSQRDESAFEALVRRYGPMVLRVCRDILNDPEDAQDAFQATFLVLSRRAGSIREPGSLGRWLYEVAARISRRERRRVWKLRSQERQALEMDAAAPPDFDPEDRELKPILHDEIRLLPSKLRDPIVLCYFEGLSVEEVARRLRCPVGTLKSRLQKGRELLRSRLTRRGLAASALLLLMFSLTEEVSAEVPEPLLASTVQTGFAGADGLGIARRVASMVLEEETGLRRFRLAASWSVLVILLLALGASKLAQGRTATASDLTAAPMNREPGAALDQSAASWKFWESESAVPDHCRAR